MFPTSHQPCCPRVSCRYAQCFTINRSVQVLPGVVLSNTAPHNKSFSKMDLIGIVNWSVQEQKEVRDLITEFGFLFALDDLYLGKTTVVKHTMKLTNPTPFKERYRQILLDQFEEMKNTCRR